MKKNLPVRKRIRLHGYDYSEENMYFITICVKDRLEMLGEIEYSIWQKSFYEHIIRNEKEYLKIKEYIKNNVINWRKDKYF